MCYREALLKAEQVPEKKELLLGGGGSPLFGTYKYVFFRRFGQK